MGVGTAAKSNTDVNLASRGAGLTLAGWEVNDGENKVFPIQVSRQELLLFLGAVIVIGTYKNIVLYECPSAYKRKLLHLWAIVVINHCLVTVPTQNRN